MFCPKCGSENPETGRFCRSCGTDLGNVSAALSGELSPAVADAGALHVHHEAKRRKDPAEVYGDAIRSVISGVGFLIVSIALLTTGVANGKAWWWAMLFPAFTFLAKGISDLMKSKKMESTRPTPSSFPNQAAGGTRLENSSLPPARQQFVAPEAESRYKTGDLVPPSVVEVTTRHLQIDQEGQTMTLPKK